MRWWLVFAGFLCCCEGFKFIVGGKGGWVENPSEEYNQWAGRNRFQVNDTLFFKYQKGVGSVLVVEKDDYFSCNTENHNPTFTFDVYSRHPTFIFDLYSGRRHFTGTDTVIGNCYCTVNGYLVIRGYYNTDYCFRPLVLTFISLISFFINAFYFILFYFSIILILSWDDGEMFD
ncbi:unnamed protein product, partial [Vitis vinifera]